MEYFESIKRLRREKGWTQQQLADKLQVSRKTVTRWENGWNVPALIYAQKMAELFEMTVGELMSGSPALPHEQAPTEEKTPHFKGLLILYCALTFLPIAIMELGERILSVMRELFRVEYGPPAMDGELFGKYLRQLEPLHKTLYWVAAIVAILLLAGWIAKLVHIFECTEDKYRRYLAYRKWRLGLVFLFACAYTALFDVYSNWWVHSYALSLKLISGFCVGFWLLLLFDTLFRRFGKEKFLAEQNRLLRKLNGVFIGIGGGLLMLFVTLLIAAWQERYFSFAFFQLLCVVAAISYLVAGAVLLSRQYRRKSD